jgi:hypothetical protein
VTYLLTALLALAAGWTWGHATARVDHILIGAIRPQDAAFIAEQRRQFDELIARLDLPDDNPGSTT